MICNWLDQRSLPVCISNMKSRSACKASACSLVGISGWAITMSRLPSGEIRSRSAQWVFPRQVDQSLARLHIPKPDVKAFTGCKNFAIS